MRRHSFFLSALCVLLVGALAAGLAARAVVMPRTGETWSAGPLNVPSVLGQTAEEVLFYPWSLYGTAPLQKLPDIEWADITGGVPLEELTMDAALSEPLASFVQPFTLIDGALDFDLAGFVSAIEWPGSPSRLFLNEYPARAGGDVPVTLSFAIGLSSAQSAYSFLVRPAQPRQLTEDEHATALAQVESDLRVLLLAPDAFSATEMGSLLYACATTALACSFETDRHLSQLTEIAQAAQYELLETAQLTRENPAQPEQPDEDRFADDLAFSDIPLESLLPLLETVGCTVQLIDTTQQVVVLFTLHSGAVLGTYYDVQLGMYSGFGVSI